LYVGLLSYQLFVFKTGHLK